MLQKPENRAEKPYPKGRTFILYELYERYERPDSVL